MLEAYKNSSIYRYSKNYIKRHIWRHYTNKFRLKLYDFPPEVWIENTNHCNASCVMCPRESHFREKGIMNIDLYKKIIQELSIYKKSIKRVHMHNFGEPLLDKKLPERIKIAKDYGIQHVYFVTNASLLNANNSREIINAGLDEFKISFYGTDTKSYNSTMVHLDFNKTLENVKTFFEIRKQMKKKNPKVIIQLIPQVIEKNDKSKWENIFNSLIDTEVGDRLNYFQLHNFSEGRNYINTESEMITNVCSYPWRTMVILHDGRVAPCCLDYNGRIEMGNVNNESIMNIWNGEKYKKIRDKFRKLHYDEYPICKKCDLPRGIIT